MPEVCLEEGVYLGLHVGVVGLTVAVLREWSEREHMQGCSKQTDSAWLRICPKGHCRMRMGM